MWDPWGPGWWIIHIEGDIHWWPQHDYREWYYIRINQVIAPKIAGKYFFKIFLHDQFFNFVYPGMPRNLPINGYECICSQGPIGNPSPHQIPGSGATNATVPVENWPVLLVKGDIEPGIIYGRIRYGKFNLTLYQQPIDMPGKVWAVGVAEGPDSVQRPVMAMGYFNQSAHGHYEIEGLAPGTYDVYASASGFPTQLIFSGIHIGKGTVFLKDGYINPGAVVHGQIFSKHLFAEEPWPSAPRPVFIEFYNTNEYKDENVITA